MYNIPWEPKISNAYRAYNIKFHNLDDRDISKNTDKVYLLYTAHSTVNGSWEPNDSPNHPANIEQWARDMYLRPWGASDYIHEAGGDHSIFIRVIKWGIDAESTFNPPRGNAVMGKTKIMWTPNYEALYNETQATVDKLWPKSSGWDENTIWASNTYTAKPFGAVHLVPEGLRMPGSHHVSWWLCYVEVPIDVFLGWQQSIVPEYEKLEDMLSGEAQKEQVIEFNPLAALQKEIFLAGFVPNSPEFLREYEGVQYIAQRSESLSTGEVRVYYVEVGKWDKVLYIEGIRE